MHRIRYYFTTLSGINSLLLGLKRRINEGYYRFFGYNISRSISAEINKYSNKEFISQNKKLIHLPDIASLDILESKYLKELKHESEKILNGRVNVLGYDEVLGLPHSWHVDFKTGYEWPKGKFYRDYDQEQLNFPCDVKVPREISRSHHILKLALTYYITKDEKFAKYCTTQLEHWIKENPLMFSINWGCTMDVAIRAVNWVWIIRLLNGSDHFKDSFIEKMKVSLYEHGWYIYRNPEKGKGYNHNHYLSDLAGQIYLGLLFIDLPEPKKWLEEAKHEFFKEIRLQILPSGMSFERSTNYNRLVLELCIWPIILLKSNKHEIPSDIWVRMEKMFEFIMHSLKPDGTSPVIGDQDNGRLLAFGPEEGLDYRYLLSLGAVLFKRPDFKRFSNGFNFYAAFSGVKNATDIFKELPETNVNLQSKLFKDVGIAILRNEDSYLLFNASGMAKYPELDPGSHTHSDLLSFELFTWGKNFLVDPGTYVYTADLEQRMLFRSTKMHNTVTVDGKSQNELYVDRPWSFDRNAIPVIIDWKLSPDEDMIYAGHNGYERLTEPIVHSRKVIFNKKEETWSVIDQLEGKGEHHFQWNFHFDSGIDFDIEHLTAKTNCADGKNISITFCDFSGLILKKESSFVSKSYGSKERANVLVAEVKSTAPIEIKILIKKLK